MESPATTLPSLEMEASLLVSGHDPEGFIAQMAGLGELADYALTPCRQVRIHDRYLDTPEGVLLSRLLSLRLREVDDKPKITLKGDTPQSGAALKVRSELEVDWSQAGLEAVLAELERQGVSLDPPSWQPDAEPLAALLACGLRVIQDRATRRRILDAHRPGMADPVAEIALDAVAFHLRSCLVRHFEVEVEAKGSGTPEDVQALVKELMARFPDRLGLWSIAKLTLGVLLERLEEGGHLGQMVRDGRLLPEAYAGIMAAARRQGLP